MNRKLDGTQNTPSNPPPIKSNESELLPATPRTVHASQQTLVYLELKNQDWRGYGRLSQKRIRKKKLRIFFIFVFSCRS